VVARVLYAISTGPNAPGIRLALMPKASFTLLRSPFSWRGVGRGSSATRSIPAGFAHGTGQRTQSWLAVSTEPAAMVTSRYWHHMKPELPADEAMDVGFQDKMVARLQELTGVALQFI
jgi:hypothetical protein